MTNSLIQIIKRTEFLFIEGRFQGYFTYSVDGSKMESIEDSVRSITDKAIQHRLELLNGNGIYEHWSEVPQKDACVVLHETLDDLSQSIIFSDGSELKISGSELTNDEIYSFIKRVQ